MCILFFLNLLGQLALAEPQPPTPKNHEVVGAQQNAGDFWNRDFHFFKFTEKAEEISKLAEENDNVLRGKLQLLQSTTSLQNLTRLLENYGMNPIPFAIRDDIEKLRDKAKEQVLLRYLKASLENYKNRDAQLPLMTAINIEFVKQELVKIWEKHHWPRASGYRYSPYIDYLKKKIVAESGLSPSVQWAISKLKPYPDTDEEFWKPFKHLSLYSPSDFREMERGFHYSSHGLDIFPPHLKKEDFDKLKAQKIQKPEPNPAVVFSMLLRNLGHGADPKKPMPSIAGPGVAKLPQEIFEEERAFLNRHFLASTSLDNDRASNIANLYKGHDGARAVETRKAYAIAPETDKLSQALKGTNLIFKLPKIESNEATVASEAIANLNRYLALRCKLQGIESYTLHPVNNPTSLFNDPDLDLLFKMGLGEDNFGYHIKYVNVREHKDPEKSKEYFQTNKAKMSDYLESQLLESFDTLEEYFKHKYEGKSAVDAAMIRALPREVIFKYSQRGAYDKWTLIPLLEKGLLDPKYTPALPGLSDPKLKQCSEFKYFADLNKDRILRLTFDESSLPVCEKFNYYQKYHSILPPRATPYDFCKNDYDLFRNEVFKRVKSLAQQNNLPGHLRGPDNAPHPEFVPKLGDEGTSLLHAFNLMTYEHPDEPAQKEKFTKPHLPTDEKGRARLRMPYSASEWVKSEHMICHNEEMFHSWMCRKYIEENFGAWLDKISRRPKPYDSCHVYQVIANLNGISNTGRTQSVDICKDSTSASKRMLQNYVINHLPEILATKDLEHSTDFKIRSLVQLTYLLNHEKGSNAERFVSYETALRDFKESTEDSYPPPILPFQHSFYRHDGMEGAIQKDAEAQGKRTALGAVGGGPSFAVLPDEDVEIKNPMPMGHVLQDFYRARLFTADSKRPECADFNRYSELLKANPLAPSLTANLRKVNERSNLLYQNIRKRLATYVTAPDPNTGKHVLNFPPPKGQARHIISRYDPEPDLLNYLETIHQEAQHFFLSKGYGKEEFADPLPVEAFQKEASGSSKWFKQSRELFKDLNLSAADQAQLLKDLYEYNLTYFKEFDQFKANAARGSAVFEEGGYNYLVESALQSLMSCYPETYGLNVLPATSEKYKALQDILDEAMTRTADNRKEQRRGINHYLQALKNNILGLKSALRFLERPDITQEQVHALLTKLGFWTLHFGDPEELAPLKNGKGALFKDSAMKAGILKKLEKLLAEFEGLKEKKFKEIAAKVNVPNLKVLDALSAVAGVPLTAPAKNTFNFLFDPQNMTPKMLEEYFPIEFMKEHFHNGDVIEKLLAGNSNWQARDANVGGVLAPEIRQQVQAGYIQFLKKHNPLLLNQYLEQQAAYNKDANIGKLEEEAKAMGPKAEELVKKHKAAVEAVEKLNIASGKIAPLLAPTFRIASALQTALLHQKFEQDLNELKKEAGLKFAELGKAHDAAEEKNAKLREIVAQNYCFPPGEKNASNSLANFTDSAELTIPILNHSFTINDIKDLKGLKEQNLFKSLRSPLSADIEIINNLASRHHPFGPFFSLNNHEFVYLVERHPEMDLMNRMNKRREPSQPIVSLKILHELLEKQRNGDKKAADQLQAIKDRVSDEDVPTWAAYKAQLWTNSLDKGIVADPADRLVGKNFAPKVFGYELWDIKFGDDAQLAVLARKIMSLDLKNSTPERRPDPAAVNDILAHYFTLKDFYNKEVVGKTVPENTQSKYDETRMSMEYLDGLVASLFFPWMDVHYPPNDGIFAAKEFEALRDLAYIRVPGNTAFNPHSDHFQVIPNSKIKNDPKTLKNLDKDPRKDYLTAIANQKYLAPYKKYQELLEGETVKKRLDFDTLYSEHPDFKKLILDTLQNPHQRDLLLQFVQMLPEGDDFKGAVFYEILPDWFKKLAEQKGGAYVNEVMHLISFKPFELCSQAWSMPPETRDPEFVMAGIRKELQSRMPTTPGAAGKANTPTERGFVPDNGRQVVDTQRFTSAINGLLSRRLALLNETKDLKQIERRLSSAPDLLPLVPNVNQKREILNGVLPNQLRALYEFRRELEGLDDAERLLEETSQLGLRVAPQRQGLKGHLDRLRSKIPFEGSIESFTALDVPALKNITDKMITDLEEIQAAGIGVKPKIQIHGTGENNPKQQAKAKKDCDYDPAIIEERKALDKNFNGHLSLYNDFLNKCQDAQSIAYEKIKEAKSKDRKDKWGGDYYYPEIMQNKAGTYGQLYEGSVYALSQLSQNSLNALNLLIASNTSTAFVAPDKLWQSPDGNVPSIAPGLGEGCEVISQADIARDKGERFALYSNNLLSGSDFSIHRLQGNSSQKKKDDYWVTKTTANLPKEAGGNYLFDPAKGKRPYLTGPNDYSAQEYKSNLTPAFLSKSQLSELILNPDPATIFKTLLEHEQTCRAYFESTLEKTRPKGALKVTEPMSLVFMDKHYDSVSVLTDHICKKWLPQVKESRKAVASAKQKIVEGLKDPKVYGEEKNLLSVLYNHLLDLNPSVDYDCENRLRKHYSPLLTMKELGIITEKDPLKQLPKEPPKEPTKEPAKPAEQKPDAPKEGKGEGKGLFGRLLDFVKGADKAPASVPTPAPPPNAPPDNAAGGLNFPFGGGGNPAEAKEKKELIEKLRKLVEDSERKGPPGSRYHELDYLLQNSGLVEPKEFEKKKAEIIQLIEEASKNPTLARELFTDPFWKTEKGAAHKWYKDFHELHEEIQHQIRLSQETRGDFFLPRKWEENANKVDLDTLKKLESLYHTFCVQLPKWNGEDDGACENFRRMVTDLNASDIHQTHALLHPAQATYDNNFGKLNALHAKVKQHFAKAPARFMEQFPLNEFVEITDYLMKAEMKRLVDISLTESMSTQKGKISLGNPSLGKELQNMVILQQLFSNPEKIGKVQKALQQARKYYLDPSHPFEIDNGKDDPRPELLKKVAAAKESELLELLQNPLSHMLLLKLFNLEKRARGTFLAEALQGTKSEDLTALIKEWDKDEPSEEILKQLSPPAAAQFRSHLLSPQATEEWKKAGINTERPHEKRPGEAVNDAHGYFAEVMTEGLHQSRAKAETCGIPAEPKKSGGSEFAQNLRRIEESTWNKWEEYQSQYDKKHRTLSQCMEGSDKKGNPGIFKQKQKADYNTFFGSAVLRHEVTRSKVRLSELEKSLQKVAIDIQYANTKLDDLIKLKDSGNAPSIDILSVITRRENEAKDKRVMARQDLIELQSKLQRAYNREDAKLRELLVQYEKDVKNMEQHETDWQAKIALRALECQTEINADPPSNSIEFIERTLIQENVPRDRIRFMRDEIQKQFDLRNQIQSLSRALVHDGVEPKNVQGLQSNSSYQNFITSIDGNCHKNELLRYFKKIHEAEDKKKSGFDQRMLALNAKLKKLDIQLDGFNVNFSNAKFYLAASQEELKQLLDDVSTELNKMADEHADHPLLAEYGHFPKKDLWNELKLKVLETWMFAGVPTGAISIGDYRFNAFTVTDKNGQAPYDVDKDGNPLFDKNGKLRLRAPLLDLDIQFESIALKQKEANEIAHKLSEEINKHSEIYLDYRKASDRMAITKAIHWNDIQEKKKKKLEHDANVKKYIDQLRKLGNFHVSFKDYGESTTDLLATSIEVQNDEKFVLDQHHLLRDAASDSDGRSNEVLLEVATFLIPIGKLATLGKLALRAVEGMKAATKLGRGAKWAAKYTVKGAQALGGNVGHAMREATKFRIAEQAFHSDGVGAGFNEGGFEDLALMFMVQNPITKVLSGTARLAGLGYAARGIQTIPYARHLANPRVIQNGKAFLGMAGASMASRMAGKFRRGYENPWDHLGRGLGTDISMGLIAINPLVGLNRFNSTRRIFDNQVWGTLSHPLNFAMWDMILLDQDLGFSDRRKELNSNKEEVARKRWKRIHGKDASDPTPAELDAIVRKMGDIGSDEWFDLAGDKAEHSAAMWTIAAGGATQGNRYERASASARRFLGQKADAATAARFGIKPGERVEAEHIIKRYAKVPEAEGKQIIDMALGTFGKKEFERKLEDKDFAEVVAKHLGVEVDVLRKATHDVLNKGKNGVARYFRQVVRDETTGDMLPELNEQLARNYYDAAKASGTDEDLEKFQKALAKTGANALYKHVTPKSLDLSKETDQFLANSIYQSFIEYMRVYEGSPYFINEHYEMPILGLRPFEGLADKRYIPRNYPGFHNFLVKNANRYESWERLLDDYHRQIRKQNDFFLPPEILPKP